VISTPNQNSIRQPSVAMSATGTPHPYEVARGPVKDAMKLLYYDWMEVKPSKYPPNMYPRVLTIEGKISQRDYLPVKDISRKQYKKFGACDAKYLEIVWEFTPNGTRADKPIILETKRVGSDTYWSFGSCHACWKLSKRDFTDTNRTKHPLRMPVDNPDLPRMGRCGCICCNQCVRELEMHDANKSECYVHCPYCGNSACFSKNLRIWVVSREIKRHVEMEQTTKLTQSVMGQNGNYKISHCEDGIMIELENIE